MRSFDKLILKIKTDTRIDIKKYGLKFIYYLYKHYKR